MPYHRRSRGRLGTSTEKHSGTKVHVIGPGTTIIANHLIRDTEVGDRTPAGNNDTITLGRSLEEECNIGDKCAYVNIHIQASNRASGSDQNIGWIEWAFACHKGDDAPPTNSNLSIHTLGDIVTKYLRNECIYTGAVPVGLNQPAVAEITLKIPKSKIQLRLGDIWKLYLFARNITSTETATDSFLVISSYNYINHH